MEGPDNCFNDNGVDCPDDGNVCSDDECNGEGTCAHPANTASCDDGLFCTETDTCADGSCVGEGDPCQGGDVCADDCNETDNDCFDPIGGSCTDDEDGCTDDECDGAGECGHANVPGRIVCDAGFGPIVAVNSASTDIGKDARPHIATDGNGTYMAVWNSNESLEGVIGDDTDILFAVSTDHGVSWSAQGIVNNDAFITRVGDARPKVATDGFHWTVVWQSVTTRVASLDDVDVHSAVTTDLGATWSDPVKVNSNGDGPDGRDLLPDVTWTGANFVAAWTTRETFGGVTGDDRDLAYATSGDGGFTWSAMAVLNSEADVDSEYDTLVDLASDTAGNVVATWESKHNQGGTINTDTDILGASSSDDGASFGASVVVNSNASSTAAKDRFPRVATDGAGNWLAAWTSRFGTPNLGVDADIFVTASSDNGATWSDFSAVNNTAVGSAALDEFPDIGADGLGQFFVTWHSKNPLASLSTDQDIQFAYTHDGGASWTDPDGIGGVGDVGKDSFPILAVDGLGRVVAAWHSDEELDGLGDDLDVFSSRLLCEECLPACEPQECGEYTGCGDESCENEGVCVFVAEGGGICVNGRLDCDFLPICEDTEDCDNGSLCIVDSCCGVNVCVPSSDFCPAPGIEVNLATTGGGSGGPTIGGF